MTIAIYLMVTDGSDYIATPGHTGLHCFGYYIFRSVIGEEVCEAYSNKIQESRHLPCSVTDSYISVILSLNGVFKSLYSVIRFGEIKYIVALDDVWLDGLNIYPRGDLKRPTERLYPGDMLVLDPLAFRFDDLNTTTYYPVFIVGDFCCPFEHEDC